MELLGRKQRRKQQRKEKKLKRNLNYQSHFNKSTPEARHQPQPHRAYRHPQPQSQPHNPQPSQLQQASDSEIDSQEASSHGSSSDAGQIPQPRKKAIPAEKDDIDRDLEYLESKLGLKKDRKVYSQLKKRAAMENYDDDIYDFLDNIDSIVKDPGSRLKYQAKADKNKEVKDLEPSAKDSNTDKSPLKAIKPKPDIAHTNSKRDLRKELNGIFNKTSESNIQLLVKDFLQVVESSLKEKSEVQLYSAITTLALKLIVENPFVNIGVISCICSYLSLLHFRCGDQFMRFFVLVLIAKLELYINELKRNSKEANSFSIYTKNVIFALVHLFHFGNVTALLFQGLVAFLVKNLTDEVADSLIVLFSHVGIELRKEHPDSILDTSKAILNELNSLKVNRKLNEETPGSQAKQNCLSLSKLSFTNEIVQDIKNNKHLKFNASEKYAFFKSFVGKTAKEMTSIKGYTLALEFHMLVRSLNEYQNLIQNLIKENISLDDSSMVALLEYISNSGVDKPLKEDKINSDEYNEKELLSLSTSSKSAERIKKLMKRFNINTDLKRSIFNAIVSASDSLECFESLVRLNLNKEQKREIVKILLQTLSEEKAYNPFYEQVLLRLLQLDKDTKYTYHYCLWDVLKVVDSYSDGQINNIAKLTARLLVTERVNLVCLLPFKAIEASPNQKKLLVLTLEHYLSHEVEIEEKKIKAKLLAAKLIKNDQHIPFAKELLQMLLKQFPSEVDLSSKRPDYRAAYESLLKVLKKAL